LAAWGPTSASARCWSSCAWWGARFFLPARKFMGDNGSMIAYTGLIMMKSGTRTPLAESKVMPGYRTDDVPVTWG